MRAGFLNARRSSRDASRDAAPPAPRLADGPSFAPFGSDGSPVVARTKPPNLHPDVWAQIVDVVTSSDAPSGLTPPPRRASGSGARPARPAPDARRTEPPRPAASSSPAEADRAALRAATRAELERVVRAPEDDATPLALFALRQPTPALVDAALDALDAERRDRAEEVERLCAEYREEFTSAVADLDALKRAFETLGARAADADDAARAAGRPLLAAREDVAALTAVLGRVRDAQAAVAECRDAAEEAAAVSEALASANRSRGGDAGSNDSAPSTSVAARSEDAPPDTDAFANDTTNTTTASRDRESSLESSVGLVAALSRLDDLERARLRALPSSALATRLVSEVPAARDAAFRAADRSARRWMAAAREKSRDVGAAALADAGRGWDAAEREAESAARRRASRREATSGDEKRAAASAEASVRRARALAGERSGGDEGLLLEEFKAATAASTGSTDRSSAGGSTPVKRRIDFTAETAATRGDRAGPAAAASPPAPSSAAADSAPAADSAFALVPPLAPLLRARAVFASQGLGAEFARFVRVERRLQLDADASSGASSKSGGADAYLRQCVNRAIPRFVGHFVAQAKVAGALPEVLPRGFVDEECDDACDALSAKIADAARRSRDAAVALAARDAAATAAEALRRAGFGRRARSAEGEGDGDGSGEKTRKNASSDEEKVGGGFEKEVFAGVASLELVAAAAASDRRADLLAEASAASVRDALAPENLTGSAFAERFEASAFAFAAEVGALVGTKKRRAFEARLRLKRAEEEAAAAMSKTSRAEEASSSSSSSSSSSVGFASAATEAAREAAARLRACVEANAREVASACRASEAGEGGESDDARGGGNEPTPRALKESHAAGLAAACASELASRARTWERVAAARARRAFLDPDFERASDEDDATAVDDAGGGSGRRSIKTHPAEEEACRVAALRGWAPTAEATEAALRAFGALARTRVANLLEPAACAAAWAPPREAGEKESVELGAPPAPSAAALSALTYLDGTLRAAAATLAERRFAKDEGSREGSREGSHEDEIDGGEGVFEKRAGESGTQTDVAGALRRAAVAAFADARLATLDLAEVRSFDARGFDAFLDDVAFADASAESAFADEATKRSPTKTKTQTHALRRSRGWSSSLPPSAALMARLLSSDENENTPAPSSAGEMEAIVDALRSEGSIRDPGTAARRLDKWDDGRGGGGGWAAGMMLGAGAREARAAGEEAGALGPSKKAVDAAARALRALARAEASERKGSKGARGAT